MILNCLAFFLASAPLGLTTFTHDPVQTEASPEDVKIGYSTVTVGPYSYVTFKDEGSMFCYVSLDSNPDNPHPRSSVKVHDIGTKAGPNWLSSIRVRSKKGNLTLGGHGTDYGVRYDPYVANGFIVEEYNAQGGISG